MQDPTQLLPAPVLTIFNSFTAFCSLLNFYCGLGWGYMAFLALLAFAAVWPGICYWSRLMQQGMSSDAASKVSGIVFMPLFVLFMLIGGYAYYHGGYIHYRRLSLADFYAHGPGLVATIAGVFMLALTVFNAHVKRRRCASCNCRLFNTSLHRMKHAGKWYCMSCYSRAQAVTPGAHIQVIKQRSTRREQGGR